jgi:hypothetical protein
VKPWVQWGALAAGCVIASCAASHRVGPDGDLPDGDLPTRDAAPDAPVRECRPLPPPTNAECTPELQRECQRWAESLTTEGYAHGSCALGWPGWILPFPCHPGYRGCEESRPHGDLPPPCICDDHQCGAEEICVSDTPDGPARCRPRCTPTSTVGG